MPYPIGIRLSGEKASKLGHLDVIKSPLVQKLIKDYENFDIEDEGYNIVDDGVSSRDVAEIIPLAALSKNVLVSLSLS